ncbi:MAG: ribose-5-phosphate isomerase A [Candidatus ainarchaeum sp.]|nr:ribose-5-phosphate isomerase A [Candidatus ainarchaeum sp.]
MDLQAIIKEFDHYINDGNIVAIGTSRYDAEFVDELVKYLLFKKKEVFFIATTSRQAAQLSDLGQKVVSLNDKEIDVAIEFIDQVDSDFNFIKKDTKSFIRDKMISQSALNLITVCDRLDLVDKITKDVSVEISSFAWERTILNLQSYGLARVVLDIDGNIIKTETGHYLARITLDKNITLEDFEYSVKNIPGVLETGVFLGMADVILIVDKNDPKNESISIRSRN